MQLIYRSTQQDDGAPGFPERSGEEVELIEELPQVGHSTWEDYNVVVEAEVGRMFVVAFCDGQTIHAFADELYVVCREVVAVAS